MQSEVSVAVTAGRLAFKDPVFAPQGEARLFTVHATCRGLDFTATAETHGDGYRFVQFLESLAADWRGWDGERHWYSDDARLTVWATHDRRRLVTMTFHYRTDRAESDDVEEPLPADEWKARVAFGLEPGHLAAVAHGVHELFSAANNPG